MKSSDVNVFENMFDEKLQQQRTRLWQVLCRDFFQRYVGPGDVLLDLGAGYCEFINTICCGRKVAVDQSDHMPRHAGPDVEVVTGSALELSGLVGAERFDTVFTSNFLEHMRTKDDLTRVLLEVQKVLKPGGSFLILQPNIRYAYKVYWDMYDHHLPISHKSLTEILLTIGFDVLEVRPKFLPWTTQSRMPKHPLLVRLYLKCPPAQALLGRQMFVYARRKL